MPKSPKPWVRYHPTVAFGFSEVNGEQRLHQLFVAETGEIAWRMVPMIELGPLQKNRKQAIAGFIAQDEEERGED